MEKQIKNKTEIENIEEKARLFRTKKYELEFVQEVKESGVHDMEISDCGSILTLRSSTGKIAFIGKGKGFGNNRLAEGAINAIELTLKQDVQRLESEIKEVAAEIVKN